MPLVAVTGGNKWFVGVDTRYDNQAVFGLFLNVNQAVGVIQYCVLIIWEHGPDDYPETYHFSADDLLLTHSSRSALRYELRRKRELFFDLCRGRQLV